MRNCELSETRTIVINDTTIELSMSPAFIERLRNHYGVNDDEPVTDKMVMNYFVEAIKNAKVQE